jgi:hypothetical protein
VQNSLANECPPHTDAWIPLTHAWTFQIAASPSTSTARAVFWCFVVWPESLKLLDVFTSNGAKYFGELQKKSLSYARLIKN